jgi:GTPase
MVDPRPPKPRAVLLGVQLPGVDDADFASSLGELGRLGKTLGLDVVGRVTQKRAAARDGCRRRRGQAQGAGRLHRRHRRGARRPAEGAAQGGVEDGEEEADDEHEASGGGRPRERGSPARKRARRASSSSTTT